MVYRELKRNLLWTLLIGTGVFVFGVVFVRAAAHWSGFPLVVYKVLMTPAMFVGLLESKVLGREFSSAVALTLGVLFHYGAYFLVISGVRALMSRFARKNS